MKAIPSHPDQRLMIGDDNPLGFISWSFDRVIHEWTKMDYSRPIVHIGPGVKTMEGETHRLEYPEFDFDGQITRRQVGGQRIEFAKGIRDSGRDHMPFKDNSVGGIVAVCVLEHLYDISWIVREAGRVLAPGCPFNIFVPHPLSVMHLEDADHKSNQVLDSWENLLNNPYYGDEKGKNGIPLKVGFNMKVALKEENTAICTQLIKMTHEEATVAEFGRGK